MKATLWTKDFTIITVGSVVSMLGNSLVGFAISLFVLDFTDAPFLYALFVFLHSLPQIAMPLIAGPFMDRFSRRRTIYLLDFLSAGLYCLAGVLIMRRVYNFLFLALLALSTGSIYSFYNVAFSSFYPMLIPEGYYSKAYSVSSTLETFSYVMIPIATVLYNLIGIAPLLVTASILFLAAALAETRISDVEKSMGKPEVRYSCKQYFSDTKEGIHYLKSERGLTLITLYFVISSFAMGASTVITLPWFRDHFPNGEYTYISVWALMAIGRIIGSLIHYHWKMPANIKYTAALFVYVVSAALEGVYLYMPILVMQIFCFLIGIFSATSYNIRISSIQNYVPNHRRARFHGVFLMLTTLGSLAGELVSGAVSSFVSMRFTLSLFMGINILGALALVGKGKKHIAPIYNQNT